MCYNYPNIYRDVIFEKYQVVHKIVHIKKSNFFKLRKIGL